ncbi:hypothetical protein [Microcoleus sp. PH2017_05_CCC_O_A]|uniref:hypothetical protein n=1 Tax=Microcoleus sp. PH2017_05_CCC_O_A TaxID=2798816 RepID=UPI0025CCAD68|nr:hypothetical protein [Microcoleus sp. PH2017_05_CCC_O_A]
MEGESDFFDQGRKPIASNEAPRCRINTGKALYKHAIGINCDTYKLQAIRISLSFLG